MENVPEGFFLVLPQWGLDYLKAQEDEGFVPVSSYPTTATPPIKGEIGSIYGFRILSPASDA